MVIRVMLVDDSLTVRSAMARGLGTPGIDIIATAADGAQAILLARQCQPDCIILDIEMPGLDGLSALPKLLEAAPKANIIMASTLTARNAAISLKALQLGAADYIAKPAAATPQALSAFYHELREKIEALSSAAKKENPQQATMHAPAITPPPALSALPVFIKALAIAASTGGPQALLKLMGDIKNTLSSIPIFITQHMPPAFTTILAENLGVAANRPCHEGKEGEKILPGHIYLAPGDFHMTVMQNGADTRLHLTKQPPVNFCRPSADPMFQSISHVYGKHVLAVVLTGMGHDGLEGAKTIAAAGGQIIAQDEASSVVWGMPKAVAAAGLCRAVLPIGEIGNYIIKIGGQML